MIASEARKIAQSVITERDNAQYNSIKTKIKEVSSTGQMTYNFDFVIRDAVYQRLVKEGYRIGKSVGSLMDRYTPISWQD